MLISWLAEAPGTMLREIDGTIVFVDISGFTKMSERLARSGKVGAEEVTEVIGSVFARLLSVAYGEGGGLIKFGGDALLLLFSDAHHPIKGARAAVGMRQALRGIGAIETTAGKVTLRMSVGLHSGIFHFFLVGESHRELVITGPAATETVLMEGTATAGEILVSQATAACLPPQILGHPKGDGVLLRTMPKALLAQRPIPESSLEGVDLLCCIPVALREHVLAGATTPEHRLVSVAFVHFDGIDELVRDAGPEAVAYGLDELVRVVQSACEKHGVTFLGTDVDKDGGKIILVAGAPTAQGDDEERMLLAVRAVIDAETTIPVRIGVNKGPVFSGEIGPSYRRTYTVMGDAVNLAARVMSKAEPRQVLATAGVLNASATRFDLIELEPFSVKGKAKPVRAWAVGGPTGSRSREKTAVRLDLVGRQVELETLAHTLQRAREGSGRMVEVVGEPGIGKSRLLDELKDGSDSMTVLHATCEAYTSSTPYVVWRELLRDLLHLRWEDTDDVVLGSIRERIEALDPDLAPWLPLIALPFDVEIQPTPEVEMLGEEFRRPKLNEVLLRFLGRVAPGPMLIEVEDAHHMDEASADLFLALAGAVEGSPWLVCLARRPGDEGFVGPEERGIVRLDIGPLDPQDALSMATAANRENPLTPHNLQVVADRSGGNPQFLLDLLDAVVATGSLEQLPDSVEAAATAQIDRLPPDDRVLVRRVSVLGLSFQPRMVDWLDPDGTEPHADRAMWARLEGVFEDDGDGYKRFRRAVVRDAAYEGLPFRTRQRLHAAAGARYETEGTDTDEISGILSLHFSLAGDHEKTWRYARTAARRAEAMFAHVEAARLYGRALESGRRLPDVTQPALASTHEAMGDAYLLAGEFVKARLAFSAARKLVRDDPSREAGLCYKQARIEDAIGRFPRSLGWTTRARKIIDRAGDDEAIKQYGRLSAWYALVLQSEGRVEDSIPWAQRAIKEAEVAGDRQALSDAYNALDSAYLWLGRDTGGKYFRLALAIREEVGDLPGQSRILNNLGLGAYLRSEWDDAVSLWERAREACLAAGDPVGARAGTDDLAEIQAARGRYEEAEPILRASLREWRAFGHPAYLANCQRTLGTLVAHMGRFEEALELLEEARATFQQIGAQGDAIDVEARIADAHLMMGRTQQALDNANDALSRRGEEGDKAEALLERVRGCALAGLGCLNEARRAFARSLEVAESRGSDYERALALAALVRCGVADIDPLPFDPETKAEEILSRLGVVAVGIAEGRFGPELSRRAAPKGRSSEAHSIRRSL
jgi:class 3 adenylate cyclase/tetratricopeptide (TPR) repeat protein